ncbi:MAG: C1 family peptidase [bacterium]
MQIHRPLNYIQDVDDPRDFKFDKRLFKNKTKNQRSKILGRLPKKIDHEQNMTPVKDQGQLGSCVGFSCVAVKEWQEWQEYLRIKDNIDLDKNPFNDLSEQWLYYNCKKIDNIPNEGTTLRAAMKVLQKKGVPNEEAWEYNPNEKGSPESWAKKIAKFTRINNYYKINNLTQLKLALLHTPVPIGVLVFKTFYKVRNNGLVELPKRNQSELGGHAICVVGYDDEMKVIKFKNSWGTRWGKRGYGYLPYKYFKKYCIMAWAFDDLFQTEENIEKIQNFSKK